MVRSRRDRTRIRTEANPRQGRVVVAAATEAFLSHHEEDIRGGLQSRARARAAAAPEAAAVPPGRLVAPDDHGFADRVITSGTKETARDAKRSSSSLRGAGAAPLTFGATRTRIMICFRRSRSTPSYSGLRLVACTTRPRCHSPGLFSCRTDRAKGRRALPIHSWAGEWPIRLRSRRAAIGAPSGPRFGASRRTRRRQTVTARDAFRHGGRITIRAGRKIRPRGNRGMSCAGAARRAGSVERSRGNGAVSCAIRPVMAAGQGVSSDDQQRCRRCRQREQTLCGHVTPFKLRHYRNLT
jgi:hypothetical protein